MYVYVVQERNVLLKSGFFAEHLNAFVGGRVRAAARGSRNSLFFIFFGTSRYSAVLRQETSGNNGRIGGLLQCVVIFDCPRGSSESF